jgi:hypothetical protein
MKISWAGNLPALLHGMLSFWYLDPAQCWVRALNHTFISILVRAPKIERQLTYLLKRRLFDKISKFLRLTFSLLNLLIFLLFTFNGHRLW